MIYRNCLKHLPRALILVLSQGFNFIYKRKINKVAFGNNERNNRRLGFIHLFSLSHYDINTDRSYGGGSGVVSFLWGIVAARC